MPRPSDHTDKGFLRFIASLMALLYLVQPLHHQIAQFMHGFSHAVGAPDYVLSHGDHGYSQEGVYDHKGHLEYAPDTHEHGIIDFFSSLMAGGSGDSDSNPLSPDPVQIDKHMGVSHGFEPDCKMDPCRTRIGIRPDGDYYSHLTIPYRPPIPSFLKG